MRILENGSSEKAIKPLVFLLISITFAREKTSIFSLSSIKFYSPNLAYAKPQNL